MVAISPSGAEDAGLIPARGARIPHALRSKKKKNKNHKQQKPSFNKFNKGFENGPHHEKRNL